MGPQEAKLPRLSSGPWVLTPVCFAQRGPISPGRGACQALATRELWRPTDQTPLTEGAGGAGRGCPVPGGRRSGSSQARLGLLRRCFPSLGQARAGPLLPTAGRGHTRWHLQAPKEGWDHPAEFSRVPAPIRLATGVPSSPCLHCGATAGQPEAAALSYPPS